MIENNSTKKRKTVGILGGMGPEATADLFLKIIKATPATKDQEHLRIVIDNNPAIPDRTAHIFGQGEDPTTLMIQGAQVLERAGADLIVIPCNTAHYFRDRVAKAVSIPILHIMEETARYVVEKHPGVRTVGLLASTGTYKVGLYEAAFRSYGIEVLIPDDRDAQMVMSAIYDVKAGRYEGPHNIMLEVGERLVTRGAGAVIGGCTEVPIVLKNGDLSVPVVDPTQCLALAAVREALA